LAFPAQYKEDGLKARVPKYLSRRQRTGNVCMRIIQGTFREHQGSIRGPSRKRSGSTQGTSREYLRNTQGIFKEHSRNIQRTLREDSGNTQGPFGEHSETLRNHLGNTHATSRDHLDTKGTFGDHSGFSQGPLRVQHIQGPLGVRYSTFGDLDGSL
jgi:hypothetical protein